MPKAFAPCLHFYQTNTMLSSPSLRTLALVLVALFGHSLSWSQTEPKPEIAPELVFTIQAEGRPIVRALTHATVCPAIQWDGKASVAMTRRAEAAALSLRGDSAQKDTKAAVFDVLTCEAHWPVGAHHARVAGHAVPAPRSAINRIVIIADTGCRMKASENAFQPCNDPVKWPFAQVASSAAALKPDLVIHIGDIHYRESPCPEGNAGCANAAWGYGFDAWQADFFKPAQPLLAAAPWVFVRGNHETCSRAGQGWFRFIDAQPWTHSRSCNDPTHDKDADYSEPYAVPVDAHSQFIIYDSSRTNGKPFLTTDVSFSKYTSQLKVVNHLSQQRPNSFFMSHHPLLAVVPAKDTSQFKLAGDKGLQSVFEAAYPERLFPESVSVSLHGHVHLFEAISFKSKHPVSLVLGNSGSANEGRVPETLPAGTELFKGALIDEYIGRADYGFVTLDRVETPKNDEWLLTEYTTMGQAVIQCTLSGGKSHCKKLSPNAH